VVGYDGTRIYVWGGMADYNYAAPISTVDAYDVAAGSWLPLGSWGNPGYFAAGVQSGTGLFMFGGLTGASSSTAVASWQEFNMWDFYNDHTSTWWGPTTFMTSTRSHAGAGLLSGTTMMVTGGLDAGSNVLASAETVSPYGVWSAIPPMGTARQDHAVAVVGSAYYAIGGRNASGAVMASAEVYVTNANGWGAAAALPIPLYGSATAVIGSKIFVLGGATTGLTVSNRVFVYDTAAASPAWAELTPLAVAVAYPAAVVVGTNIYVVGGDKGGTANVYGSIQVVTP